MVLAQLSENTAEIGLLYERAHKLDMEIAQIKTESRIKSALYGFLGAIIAAVISWLLTRIK